MSKIPDALRCKVLSHEDKANARTPTLRLTGLGSFAPDGIGRIFSRVPFFDERNTRISCSNGVHTIRLPNAEALEGILAKSGQTLSNGMTPRITKVEVKKSLEEICDFISAELKTQERSANLSRGGNQWQGNQGWGQRGNSFSVTAEQKDTGRPPSPAPQGAPRTQSSSGRRGRRAPSPAPSRPVTPPADVQRAEPPKAGPSAEDRGRSRSVAPSQGKGVGGDSRGGGGTSGRKGEGGKGGSGTGNSSAGQTGGAGAPLYPFKSSGGGRGNSPSQKGGPARDQSPMSRSTGLGCYHCGEPDHWRSECPNLSMPRRPFQGEGERH